MLNTRGTCSLLMLGKSKADVEEKDHDEDKSEVLGNLVKVVVLIWSASLLTFKLRQTSKRSKNS